MGMPDEIQENFVVMPALVPIPHEVQEEPVEFWVAADADLPDFLDPAESFVPHVEKHTSEEVLVEEQSSQPPADGISHAQAKSGTVQSSSPVPEHLILITMCLGRILFLLHLLCWSLLMSLSCPIAKNK